MLFCVCLTLCYSMFTIPSFCARCLTKCAFAKKKKENKNARTNHIINKWHDSNDLFFIRCLSVHWNGMKRTEWILTNVSNNHSTNLVNHFNGDDFYFMRMPRVSRLFSMPWCGRHIPLYEIWVYGEAKFTVTNAKYQICKCIHFHYAW